MVETTPQTAPDSGGYSLRSLFSNPVTTKELRSRMRGRRAFAVLTLYLVLLSAAILFVYLIYSASSGLPSSNMARTAGKGLFAVVLGVQVLLVAFIGPAFTAGAITGERERQTFDLLRTTLLSAGSLVRGKLVSALSYILLLVVVSIPLQSIAFLLGGLSFTELALSQLLILVAAVTYALYGLWCSATMRSTLAATVATFAGTLFVTFGIPIMVFIAVIFVGNTSLMFSPVNPLFEVLAIYVGVFMAAINLPAALITSAVILLNEQSLIGFTNFAGARSIWIPSPWYLYIVLHALAAVWLYISTVRRVRRVSDE